MRVKVLTGIFLICLLSGCAVSDTTELKRTVKNYDKKLIMALAQGNAEVLRDYATQKQMGRVYIYIGELLKKNSMLKVESVKFTVKEARKVTSQEVEKLYTQRRERLEKQNLFVVPFEVSDKVPHALVRTEETWKHTYIDSKSRRPVSEAQDIAYRASYFLVMKNGKWLIDNVDAIEIPLQK